jgi:vitamin B12 transporter
VGREPKGRTSAPAGFVARLRSAVARLSLADRRRLELNPIRIVQAALGAGLLIAGPAWSQTARDEKDVEELVVTASRSGQGVRADLMGGSATVLTAEQLEVRQVRQVSDVLRDVPGVSVNRVGPAGGFTQVRLRGAEANHTLTLIDGMDASDPFQGEFDYSTLIADDVARIEVLRGQQSALYGSQAIGGVIHYITATGAEAPGVRGRVEGGSFGTFSGAARVGGVSGDLDVAASVAGVTSDGTRGARNGTKDYGYDNAAASGKLTWSPSETFRVKAVGRWSETDADAVSQDFNFPPGPSYGFAVDGDDSLTNRALMGLLRAELDLLDGRWTSAVTVQGNDTKRRSLTLGQVGFGGDGTRAKQSLETTLHFGSETTPQSLTFAVDNRRETYRNIPVGPPTPINDKRTLSNLGYVAEYGLAWNDRLGASLAARHDENKRFADATTYRGQVSYRFDGGVRLRAAAGSGITAPTNFELFGFDPQSFIGNPNLKPERSQGWEAGVDYATPDRAVRLGLTYFDSRLKDEIYTAFTPNFVSTPANRTTTSTQQGIEATAQARFGEAWSVDAAFTALRARDGAGLESLRRPSRTASLNLDWRDPEGRGGATLTVRYNGESQDSDFTDPFASGRATLPAYTLVNLAGDWKIAEKVELFGRVENLFDERYEEVYTFVGQGRAAYVGVRAGF